MLTVRIQTLGLILFTLKKEKQQQQFRVLKCILHSPQHKLTFLIGDSVCRHILIQYRRLLRNDCRKK